MSDLVFARWMNVCLFLCVFAVCALPFTMTGIVHGNRTERWLYALANAAIVSLWIYRAGCYVVYGQ